MTLLHDNDRNDLEDGVRTMLHRLAAGVDESPPAWEDLIRRRDPAGPVLGLSAPIHEVRNRRTRPERRARLSMAAAVVVLLAVAGVVVAARPGAEPTDEPSTESISLISPGDPSFDAGAAAAVWATGIGDPVSATTAYLAAMGVPVDAVAPPAVELLSTADATAVVEWSLPGVPGAPGGSSGTVYLRSSSIGGAPPTWTVVGSATSDVALADVRYDGDELSFTVARTSAEAEQLAVGVWVDGQPVSLGGDAVAQAGAGDVSLGELVDLGAAADAQDTLTLPVEADDIVTLRIVEVVDGTVRSLTQMAVALPDADPEVAAAGLPSLDAAGQAAGQVGAGTGGSAGSATVDGEAEGSAGTELLPGVTVPSLPQLPPLPALPTPSTPLPTVPGVPLPALPTAPTTVPGSITDHLP